MDTYPILGLLLLLWTELNIYYYRAGKALAISNFPSVMRLRISNLVSLTQHSSPLGDDSPCERQMILISL